MALQDWKRNAEKLTVEVVGKLWKVKSVAFDCHCAMEEEGYEDKE